MKSAKRSWIRRKQGDELEQECAKTCRIEEKVKIGDLMNSRFFEADSWGFKSFFFLKNSKLPKFSRNMLTGCFFQR